MNSKKEKAALIIIDMQQGFDNPVWGKPSNPFLQENVENILKFWRENGSPVFHIQHLSKNPESPLSPLNSGVEFMDCTKPKDDEPIIQKNVNSCFIGTNLEVQLHDLGIKNLVFVGIASDHCVSTSTRMAANLGFHCQVISDATTSFDREGFDGKKFSGDIVHQISLASLHQEFATVLSTSELIVNGSHS